MPRKTARRQRGQGVKKKVGLATAAVTAAVVPVLARAIAMHVVQKRLGIDPPPGLMAKLNLGLPQRPIASVPHIGIY